MGRAVWISGSVLAFALALSFAIQINSNKKAAPVALVDTDTQFGPLEQTRVEIGSPGSALSTAAFGLSALQPETFNSQMVRDIIEASPLHYGEKDRLTAKLMAAEAGQAKLPRVLEDIRVSLAVE
ncbi:MAG: hypothetical protein AAFR73_09805 [Pseudomonadota bacterium]